MFCPNCGNKLTNNESFCGACGQKMNDNTSFSEKIKQENKLGNFIKKNKKQLKIVTLTLCILLVLGVLFENLIGFEKFGWDKTYRDYKLDTVSPTKIKLGLKFSNRDKLSKIKYDVSCGDITRKGKILTWDLSKEVGTCTIKVKYKLRTIKKSYTVVKTPDENLGEDLTALKDSDDFDNDGISNADEAKYNTDPLLSDTDMDGLSDYEETFTYKTNPLESDTDNDGVNDYNEITLGLDPLKSDSKNDGIKDSDRELTYNVEDNGIKLNINGTGNIASSEITTTTSTKISNKTGLINKLYKINTSGSIKNAKVTINYTEEELQKYGISENNLTLFGYDATTTIYKALDTNINFDTKEISGILDEFYFLVLGDKSIFNPIVENEILFIIDNSWSMYPKEAYEESTGNKLIDNSNLNNDPTGLRFSLTKSLIEKLEDKNFTFGLAEFRKDYQIANEIGSSTSDIKSTLSHMNGNFITSTAGTNIVGALKNGISAFSNDKNKYIVLLTDGEDDYLEENVNKIIAKANEKEVKICSIGFNDGANNLNLANISSATGCQLFSASNANGLVELFTKLQADLLDSLVDLDDDLLLDGLVLADSGFVVNRDGFSFENYGSNFSPNGHCYGMATFAEFYYLNKLPLVFPSVTVDNKTSYAYNLNNTYFASYANLYDYKLKSDILKYQFGFSLFDEDIPSDYKIIEDNALKYNKKYRKKIESSDVLEIVSDKTPVSKKRQKELYGEEFVTYERLIFNEDKMQKSNLIEKSDKELFNAIYAMYIKQMDEILYYSGSEPLFAIADLLNMREFEYYSSNAFINILASRILSGDVPVISSEFNKNSSHAINAISLIQDIKNQNRFYIGVYDNNHPGELRYVNIICNKKHCVTEANDYYNSSKKPIRISPSLDYDLKYFNK